MPPRSTIVTITFLIGLLHAYIGWRILPDLPVDAVWRWFGVVLLALSTVLIPLGLLSRAVQRSLKRPAVGDALAWTGLIATGLFSSLLIATLARDVVLTVAGWAGWYSLVFLRDSAAAVPLLAVLVTLVGFVNARRTARVVDVEVPIAELPAALQGFTIAQISDIHVGPTIKRGYLDRIVSRVNALEADLIAITGDLVDGSVQELAPHTAPLSKLSARHGTYFVTGNHEYYSNAHAWIAEVRRLGLRVLLNEHVVLEHDGALLIVAGVTDYSAHQFDPAHRSDPMAALAGAPGEATIKVLLAHQPRTAPAAADAGFHLQLSGHTHGGQFFPWNLFVPLQQPFTAGLNRLRNLWVYTSRGTGYWGPPKRFGAPSEITRVRLVAA
jgi:uncharacterized protein